MEMKFSQHKTVMKQKMLLTFDDIDKITCSRIGIIPYVIQPDGGLHFLLGIDNRTFDLCDFGGRVEKNESNLTGAVREFMEESKEIIQISEFETTKCAIYDERNSICILFCRATKSDFYETALADFRAAPNEYEYQEMIDIQWLSQDEMTYNIYRSHKGDRKQNRFWNRVRYAFYNSADWNDELLGELRK